MRHINWIPESLLVVVTIIISIIFLGVTITDNLNMLFPYLIAFSLVCAFSAVIHFTKSKMDWYLFILIAFAFILYVFKIDSQRIYEVTILILLPGLCEFTLNEKQKLKFILIAIASFFGFIAFNTPSSHVYLFIYMDLILIYSLWVSKQNKKNKCGIAALIFCINTILWIIKGDIIKNSWMFYSNRLIEWITSIFSNNAYFFDESILTTQTVCYGKTGTILFLGSLIAFVILTLFTLRKRKSAYLFSTIPNMFIILCFVTKASIAFKLFLLFNIGIIVYYTIQTIDESLQWLHKYNF